MQYRASFTIMSLLTVIKLLNGFIRTYTHLHLGLNIGYMIYSV